MLTSSPTLLSERFGGAQAFFCNSGAEAIEAALKYARKATGKPGIVALEGGFHGRTLGALSATGQPGEAGGVRPARPRRALRPAERRRVARRRGRSDGDVGLILLEPILGEGGVIPLDAEFVRGSRAGRELGALLCFDEVQTGRRPHGHVLRLRAARASSPTSSRSRRGSRNGLPIGALLVARRRRRRDSARATTARPSAATRSSCAAACAVVEAIDDELLANVARAGRAARRRAAPSSPACSRCAGRGLLLGAVLDRPPARSSTHAASAGCSSSPPGADVLRLAPPLVVTADEVDEALGDSSRDGARVSNPDQRERQSAILRLVRERAISTQAELVEALREDGFDVVQTTSRATSPSSGS